MTYIGYIFIIIFVYLIVRFSRRETERTLEQIKRSEKLLSDERGVLENLINQRTSELAESERMRNIELERNAKFGELSRGLFHDLMNPLTSLSLYVENLNSDRSETEQSKDMLSKAIVASRRMESFMNSIRHTSTEISDTSNNETDLANELRIVHDLLAYKARMAGVEIKIEKFPPLKIHLNSYRLHQLLLNLTSNALEACISKKQNSGSADDLYMVQIKIKNDKEKIQIIVDDNGCGISSENLAKIFESAFTTKSSGTGIGLMTIKRIVDEELHGTISVESKEGVGTTCTVTIPKN